jgi:hypothetical protein
VLQPISLQAFSTAINAALGLVTPTGAEMHTCHIDLATSFKRCYLVDGPAASQQDPGEFLTWIFSLLPSNPSTGFDMRRDCTVIVGHGSERIENRLVPCTNGGAKAGTTVKGDLFFYPCFIPISSGEIEDCSKSFSCRASTGANAALRPPPGGERYQWTLPPWLLNVSSSDTHLLSLIRATQFRFTRGGGCYRCKEKTESFESYYLSPRGGNVVPTTICFSLTRINLVRVFCPAALQLNLPTGNREYHLTGAVRYISANAGGLDARDRRGRLITTWGHYTYMTRIAGVWYEINDDRVARLGERIAESLLTLCSIYVYSLEGSVAANRAAR